MTYDYQKSAPNNKKLRRRQMDDRINVTLKKKQKHNSILEKGRKVTHNMGMKWNCATVDTYTNRMRRDGGRRQSDGILGDDDKRTSTVNNKVDRVKINAKMRTLPHHWRHKALRLFLALWLVKKRDITANQDSLWWSSIPSPYRSRPEHYFIILIPITRKVNN